MMVLNHQLFILSGIEKAFLQGLWIFKVHVEHLLRSTAMNLNLICFELK